MHNFYPNVTLKQDYVKKKNEHIETSEASHLLNIDLLRQIILGLEQGLADRGLALPPDKKAELITLLYEQAVKTREAPTQQTVDRYLRLVA